MIRDSHNFAELSPIELAILEQIDPTFIPSVRMGLKLQAGRSQLADERMQRAHRERISTAESRGAITLSRMLKRNGPDCTCLQSAPRTRRAS